MSFYRSPHSILPGHFRPSPLPLYILPPISRMGGLSVYTKNTPPCVGVACVMDVVIWLLIPDHPIHPSPSIPYSPSVYICGVRHTFSPDALCVAHRKECLPYQGDGVRFSDFADGKTNKNYVVYVLYNDAMVLNI